MWYELIRAATFLVLRVVVYLLEIVQKLLFLYNFVKVNRTNNFKIELLRLNVG